MVKLQLKVPFILYSKYLKSIHSFIQCIFIMHYCEIHAVIGTGDTAVCKQEEKSAFMAKEEERH